MGAVESDTKRKDIQLLEVVTHYFNQKAVNRHLSGKEPVNRIISEAVYIPGGESLVCRLENGIVAELNFDKTDTGTFVFDNVRNSTRTLDVSLYGADLRIYDMVLSAFEIDYFKICGISGDNFAGKLADFYKKNEHELRGVNRRDIFNTAKLGNYELSTEKPKTKFYSNTANGSKIEFPTFKGRAYDLLEPARVIDIIMAYCNSPEELKKINPKFR